MLPVRSLGVYLTCGGRAIFLGQTLLILAADARLASHAEKGGELGGGKERGKSSNLGRDRHYWNSGFVGGGNDRVFKVGSARHN